MFPSWVKVAIVLVSVVMFNIWFWMEIVPWYIRHVALGCPQ